MFTRFYGSGFSVAISRLMFLTFVTVLPFIGGCGEDDNPIIDDEHDHEHEAAAAAHADADGFFLEVEEVEVYRQLQGAHNGGLTVGAGEEIDVHVVFLDANGAEVHLDEVQDSELYTLGLTDYDSAIIDIHLFEAEAEAEPDGHVHGEELGFEVVGLKAGTTEIKLQLLHGDHPDFTGALLIPVTVQ
ncbi:hypothetical protein C6503_14755 [Candidatus Poribacteria bacterium]|nr:MAG: hypothetical protein C6503_14755 [Candidatus Poribacteria bacterium]